MKQHHIELRAGSLKVFSKEIDMFSIGAYDYQPSGFGNGLLIKSIGDLGLNIGYSVVDDYGMIVDCQVPEATILN
jgi:hypothetical protein